MFCDGKMLTFQAVVLEMNRLGLVVDLGGASSTSSMDAMRVSRASVIMSNVKAASKCPPHVQHAVGDAVLAKLVRPTYQVEFISRNLCTRF